jgi:hypothetical protein
MGLIAHTCVEATVRFAVELGYEVTMTMALAHLGMLMSSATWRCSSE